MANSEIRKGQVSSVDYETGMVRVTYKDKDESVTMDMAVLNFNDEYHMPEPGQDVIVAHMSNGSSRAVLLGTIWNKKNMPKETGEKLYRKDLSRQKDAAYVRYDDETGEYMVKAAAVHINGVDHTLLDGPKVEIAANISMLLQAEKMKIDTSEVELTGNGEDKISTKIKADVSVDQEEHELEAVFLKAFLRFVEDFRIHAEVRVEVAAEETVSVTAGTELSLSGESSRISGKSGVDISSGQMVRFSDGEYSITLKEIVERLGG